MTTAPTRAPARPPKPAEPSYEEQYELAMTAVGPGNWRALTVLYSSPDDAKTQAALANWLDKYAKNAEDAKVLLDGRDNAGEAGIRDNAYDEIARRLRFTPVVAAVRPKRQLPERRLNRRYGFRQGQGVARSVQRRDLDGP